MVAFALKELGGQVAPYGVLYRLGQSRRDRRQPVRMVGQTPVGEQLGAA